MSRILLTANETQLPAGALAALRWNHLHFTPGTVDVDVPDFPRRGPRPIAQITIRQRAGSGCAVSALRRLRLLGSDNDAAVFGSRWGPCDRNQVGRVLQMLPHKVKPPGAPQRPLRGAILERLVARAGAPTPAQLRDRALMLIGYGAALRGREAIALQRSEVTIEGRGLLVHPAGRASPVGIPALGNAYCAKAAWIAWLAALDEAGMRDPDDDRVSPNFRDRDLDGEHDAHRPELPGASAK